MLVLTTISPSAGFLEQGIFCSVATLEDCRLHFNLWMNAETGVWAQGSTVKVLLLYCLSTTIIELSFYYGQLSATVCVQSADPRIRNDAMVQCSSSTKT